MIRGAIRLPSSRTKPMAYVKLPSYRAGQVHGGVMLKPALEQLDISESTILADKAYGSMENCQYISYQGAEYCIPPKKNAVSPWECDYYHYKERHLVECFFMKNQGLSKRC